MPKFKQIILIVLDGFGVASPSDGNAIWQSNPRNLNYLINNYPATTLQASGPAVGLPWGERGNSEVGHMNLGAGRIVSQDLPRIHESISSGEFFTNPQFRGAMEHAKNNKSKLHLVGMVSSGGVHSAVEHLYSLLSMAAGAGLSEVYVHLFTDGRDTPPKVALSDLDKLSRKFLDLGVGKIATITGRFYAMDRGQHWEVTEKTYRAMVFGEGQQAEFARQALMDYYQQQIFDETIPPTVLVTAGRPIANITDGDSVVFFNFRPDRMIQLVRAFADPAFDEFSQKYTYLKNMFYVTMTLYGEGVAVGVAFPPQDIHNGLPEILSHNHLKQFHIAESEKYAHVTSFFNGGRDNVWPLEERSIVTSPVAYERRYADVPEMSAKKITDEVISKLQNGSEFILANFANADMVGHTANKAACLLAVQAVDKYIGAIFEEAEPLGACVIVTADHGNIEQIINLRTGVIDKEHSTNPVPLIIAGKGLKRQKILQKGYLELAAIVPEGVLSDVAPTILELYGIAKPPEMSSVSLLPILSEQIT